MYYDIYRQERLMKQIYMLLFGVLGINISMGIKAILNENNSSN
jgi:hypothetical protein